jgi:hypothetical protein
MAVEVIAFKNIPLLSACCSSQTNQKPNSQCTRTIFVLKRQYLRGNMGFFKNLFGGNNQPVSQLDSTLIDQLINIERLIAEPDENLEDFYDSEVRNSLEYGCSKGISPFACLNLALLYLYGINVPQNSILAEALLLKSVSIDAGFPLSYKYLALIEDEGKQNLERAIYYLQLGSAFDDPVAMTSLGYYCMTGKGMAIDKSRAIKLWKQAAKLGNKDAIRNLETIT